MLLLEDKDHIVTRAYILAEAPQLQLNEVFTPTMALNGYKHLFSDPSTPEQGDADPTALSINGNARLPSVEHGFVQRNDHTPTRPRPRQRPQSDNCLASSPAPDSEYSLSSSQILFESETPAAELGAPQWSAAVGRATTGKSGRVIERLMGDKDRLQREKHLATVKLEEEVKRSESARSALESLQISNAHLVSMHETEKTSLAKKDRRIEEMRADLEAERTRRERAEKETRETRRERDNVVENLRREAAEDKQLAQRANSQYEVLSGSWKSMEERYETRLSKLRADLKELQIQVEDDRHKMTHVEVILEQISQEGERSTKAKEKIFSNFEAYKAEQEAGLQSIRHRAKTNDIAHDKTLEQLQNVLGDMRYVVNINRNMHLAGDDRT